MPKYFVVPDNYGREHLQTKSCKPLVDMHYEQLMEDIIMKPMTYNEFTFLDEEYANVGVNKGFTRPIFNDFKHKFTSHLLNSKLNKLSGFEKFNKVEITLGCAQYIDNLHIKHDVQIMKNEYSYHQKLNPSLVPKTLDTIESGKELVISLPFCQHGSIHTDMDDILDKCSKLNIPVHIDGAWITASRDINFDFSHPAIKSVAISMSKGYGLSAWNRIGLRWSNVVDEDSITVLNDYIQINTYSVVIGNYFLDHTEPDHLWNKHGDKHLKICNDFDLEPSNTIHIGKQNGNSVGLSPLIRYLEYVQTN